jgi:hypothetical protein
LLGHAAKKLVECVAALVGKPFRQVCVSAGIPVLLATSIKKGLDCEWSDPAQKADALQRLLERLESLQLWIEKRMPAASHESPLLEHVQLLQDLMTQNLEPDAAAPSKTWRRRSCARP